ncbi:unnamed protein product [Callosobruchus maculatus]|uniref:Alanine--glyoxylate aminotransferase 2, mitochondrial n=1 Tax=Callosobruchus maculatus TaxID=64391 RepID=A0A653CL00_CALMS|nr:unnamed protein product [Callosobruchus maculatus]
MKNPRILCSRSYSTKLQLPKCDVNPPIYKGLSLEEMVTIRKKNLNPTMTTYYRKSLAFHSASKQWLFDIDGNRYLDMFGGISTVSVGHCHSKITKALAEQSNILGHVSNVYFNEKIHEYAKRLADTMPGNLKCVYFVNSGSEANDLALLMARAHTGRYDVFSLKNCYHGMTYQVMEMTSLNTYKFSVPGSPGIYKTAVPDVYKGIWGGNKCRDSPVQADRKCSCMGVCEAGISYIEEFKSDLAHMVSKHNLAGFWAETIQGVGGIVQFPKNYIKGVYEVVKQHGGLFVADEVQAGFGRTGDHFWGFEMHGITPDIVTMAKGIGNGFPLAAVVTTPEIAQGLGKATHFNTFGGNPLACAVGMAVLDIIEEEKLQENAKTVGTKLLLDLAKLRDKYEIVGDVRGKGLMIGMELVDDKTSKKPLSSEKCVDIMEKCKSMGLVVGKGGLYGNVLRLSPPMCITEQDATFTVQVLDKALSEVN